MNPLAWVVIALKTWPEALSLPEALEDASPEQLAEARSRLAEIGQIVTELRKLVDRQLVPHLEGGVMRYGDTILKPSSRGRPIVVDPDGWWSAVSQGVARSENGAELLAALYPASAVRLGAIPKLALALEVDPQALRSTFIDWEPPSSVIDAQPLSKAPLWTHKLADGQLSNRRHDDRPSD